MGRPFRLPRDTIWGDDEDEPADVEDGLSADRVSYVMEQPQADGGKPPSPDWDDAVDEQIEKTEKEIDDVYEDRNLLACALAQATGAPAGWKPAPDEGDEWAIVWITTPKGQVSWHVPRDMVEEIGLPRGDVDYDGYDRDEKNDRLASWAKDGSWY